MSSDEYEYDSLSDSDEEIYITETMWQNIQKRLHFDSKGITITLFESDAFSILYTLKDIIRHGITHQRMVYNCQIESMHNAIVHNPSKTCGLKRLKEMKYIEHLMATDHSPKMNESHIHSLILNISTKNVEINEFPNLEHLTINGNVFKITTDICHLKSFTLQHADRCPIMPNTKIDSIILNDIKNFEYPTYLPLNSTYHLMDMQINETTAMSIHKVLSLVENVYVKHLEKDKIEYFEWKTNKKIYI